MAETGPVWVDGRLVDPAHPEICVHHVGVSPGLWCGACREGHVMSVPDDVLDRGEAALRDHRGPSFVTVASERGVDGREYPVAWEAHCRCGEVTREYETHLLTVIAAAVLGAGAGAGVEPPPCPDHRETQHRDRKPPWCNRCGWRHAVPARPAVKVKDVP